MIFRTKANTVRIMFVWLIFLLLFPTNFLLARGDERVKKGSPEWYRQGPQKDWSDSEFQDYYRWQGEILRKQSESDNDDQIIRRQWAIINGNKITSEIWNYGSISSPGNKITDIVWEGLGYGYEFGPLICAEVEVAPHSHPDAYIKLDESGNPIINAEGDTVWAARVISEGLISFPERSPDLTEFWGWEPLAYSDDGVPYADPNSENIPTSGDIDRDGDGKPDSWPEGWYNPNLKEYVWPGVLKQGASNADLEAFFVIDDRRNKEFEYYPFPDDSSRKGLGVEIECRYYQWSNPLAEDIIFLIYKVTNKSPKDLQEVIFGMWGDPHIGGPSDYQDDLSFFDRNINMVYAWDEDGISDVGGRIPGYFGYKFLESPGNPLDGIDNDNDGMIDESQSDGIDNDGDWDPEKDDIGVDGIPNTGDEGEGDGVPTAGDPFDIRKPGEPNFEWTDLDEADMIGLTGFAAPPYLEPNAAKFDDYFYRNFLTPGEFDTTGGDVAGDNIFLYSSGTMTLPAGESRRFSIALIVGQDFEDLTLNALTAQDIYEKNYQFAKPPEKPKVTVVPGDEKVTLYWDNIAESSVDPISGKEDFEGYVIYRSLDPQFLDQQTITDANGSRFLFEPLKMVTGAPAKFDLINEYSGFSNIPFTGRGVYYKLGSNTGLRHSFVDSNNVINGQTYYYAVVSYDHGDDSLMIAPVECSKRITVDPERNEILLDVNTIMVVPRAPAAGYQPGVVENNWIAHLAGVATGKIQIEILDPRRLEDNNEFRVTFNENPTIYSVEDMKPIQDTITVRVDQFVRLTHKNINDSSFILTNLNGTETYERDVDYELIPETGQIIADSTGLLVDDQTYIATYRYFGVVASTLVGNEENNPVFDGMKIFVMNEPLELDTSRMGWTSTSKTNFTWDIKPFGGNQSKKYPSDYEVRFASTLIDSSSRPGYGYIKANFQIWDVTEGRIPNKLRMIILELPATEDSVWSPGERVVILQGEETSTTSWEFNFFEPLSGDTIPPSDGDVFYIATTRSFSSEDIYTFTTKASTIVRSQAMSDLDRIAAVPNPYVVTNVLEQLDLQNRTDRGPRRMYFNHLPQDCTIRIYTITGELVETLEHHSTIDDGKEYWDLTTKDNFPIAFGIYIFHVDAGDLGEKIGRFAVIK